MPEPVNDGTVPPARPKPWEHAAQPSPIPWHFKLVSIAAAVYVALRIVQMLGWVGVSVKDLHNAVALGLIALNGVVAVWGLLAWWRNWPLIQGYVVLALLGWFAFLPEILLGLALYANHHRAPLGWQHYIYGAGAVLGMVGGSFYRRRLRGREAMLFGIVALFMSGVALRGFLTGHGY